MEIQLINNSGLSESNIVVPDTIFGREFNEALVHQIVVAYQANARVGSRKQKDRQEVKHSTKKPWRQKGTGRARAGMRSSPIWRGGGRAFPSSPDENFSQKVNKKMYRVAICSILSQLVREKRLSIIEDFAVDSPKTKLLALKIKKMGLNSTLVVIDKLEQNLVLASRNLQNIMICEPKNVSPSSLVYYQRILITKLALKKFLEILV